MQAALVFHGHFYCTRCIQQDMKIVNIHSFISLSYIYIFFLISQPEWLLVALLMKLY